MLFAFLVKLVVMVLTLLLVIPVATSGNVAIRRGGFLSGLLVVICIGLANSILWLVSAFVTLGGVILVNWLTFGLIGLIINASAYMLVAKALPESFKVKSFGSAVIASLIMTVVSFLVTHIV